VAARSLALRNISVDHVTPLDLWHISELAADWDTLGWVHLAQGDVDRAERFVRASWMLLQNAEVGDHLGQIYEKRGRRHDAVRMYALALNAERPDEKTRERLAALVGADGIDGALKEQHDALVRERTIVLDRPGPSGASADFFVVFAGGSVETVKFIGGDERLRLLADALRTAKFDVVFPDDHAMKLVRRGTLSCAPDVTSTATCRFVLMLPYDAQLAQQD
jgi:hypothetical protein